MVEELEYLSDASAQEKTNSLLRLNAKKTSSTHMNGKGRALSLEKFIGQHHLAYVTLQECANHVQHQMPMEFTWVQHLLQAIQCSDPGLQASMALVKADKDGMMNDFEAAASYLLPYDPLAN
jgi:hypothetical protein